MSLSANDRAKRDAKGPATHHCGICKCEVIHCPHPDVIRPYGPGKFRTILDAYVWDVSLGGGTDSECGSTDGGSWYGLMRHGHTIFKDHDPLLETLHSTESEQLLSCAGVIIREDSDGFVAVSYYDTEAELNRAWNQIEAEHPEEEEGP